MMTFCFQIKFLNPNQKGRPPVKQASSEEDKVDVLSNTASDFVNLDKVILGGFRESKVIEIQTEALQQ